MSDVKRFESKQYLSAREGIAGNIVESILIGLRHILPGKRISHHEAALILNVSESYLETLLEEKDIPHVRIGSLKLIKYKDLMDYKAHRDKDRLQGLAELVALSQECDKIISTD